MIVLIKDMNVYLLNGLYKKMLNLLFFKIIFFILDFCVWFVKMIIGYILLFFRIFIIFIILLILKLYFIIIIFGFKIFIFFR